MGPLPPRLLPPHCIWIAAGLRRLLLAGRAWRAACCLRARLFHFAMLL
jgi:hypothetical protein